MSIDFLSPRATALSFYTTRLQQAKLRQNTRLQLDDALIRGT
jgi:hypothetical protein